MNTSEYISYLDVPSLTPEDPLDTLSEIWYQILFWVLVSSVLVHSVAASVAFYMLKSHKTMRWYALAIMLVGVVGPLTWGNITSVLFAWICLNSRGVMPGLYAFLAGIVQTVICTIVSFCRVFPSL
ncbi:Transmembrane protein 170A [Trichuris trichiura]|uniref:Transmembrane protein 170A n=1 Tax=Trichuris trichiura TaxID=36087 RepID=A0A077Z2E2_TRITR|nr:Transmembrane protein 170A [Trichuris trichiura]